MDKKDKLLFQCSLDELRDYLRDNLVINHGDGKNTTTNQRYVYGIQGLQELFHCCHTTACQIKKSGIIDAAITQIRRKIVIDADLALELIRRHRIQNHGY